MAQNPYFFEYPDRVTEFEPGVYRWQCRTSKKEERKAYSATIKACIIIAVFVLVMSVVFCIMLDDWGGMWIEAVCVGVFMLIALLICWGLDRLPGGVREMYVMTDTYLKSGTGRASAYFSYKRTKVIMIYPDHIELIGPFGGPGVFAPPEDLPFVRAYMLSRMPGTARIEYKDD